jgi:hypothetical protein
VREAKLSAVSAARVFSQQPDRVAAAWRRVRLAQASHGAPVHNLLDDVVEPFIRELGRNLEGAAGSAWARTRGVLRVSPERGVQALQEEFVTLLRCLGDALNVLGAGPVQQALVRSALQEAMESALAHAHQLVEPSAPSPRVPFGGLVVELFERRAPARSTHAAAPPRGMH